MTGVHLYLRLLQYVRPYWWAFGLAVIGMAVVAAGDLVMAMLVIPIVNNFQNPDPVRTQWLPLAVIAVFVLRGLGSFVSEYGMAYTGHRVVFDLRCSLVDKLLRLPTSYYDVTPSGVVQSRLTFDAHQLARHEVRQRAAQLDDQAIVGERRELADHPDPRRARRGHDHLGRAGAKRIGAPGSRHVRVVRRDAVRAPRSAQVVVGHQCRDPA